jgi:hypothetical protein
MWRHNPPLFPGLREVEIVCGSSQFMPSAIVKRRTFRAPLAQLLRRLERTGSGKRATRWTGWQGTVLAPTREAAEVRGRADFNPNQARSAWFVLSERTVQNCHGEEGWRPAVVEEQGVSFVTV